MRALRIIFTAVFAAGFSLSLPAQLVNAIKAVVHDAVVTKYEVETYTAPAEEVLRRQYYRTQPDTYERKLLEALNENMEERVKRQLILHDFKTGGYNLPEAIIQDSVDEEIRTRWGGREKLIKSLQAQGMTYEKFRQQIRENIIRRALTAKNISQEIIVSPHRMETYYLANKQKFDVQDEVKLRMIVLNKSTEPASVRRLAEEIRSKIQGGAAFSEMAGVYSQGRNPGGDWGWVEKSVLRKELAEVAFNLKVGTVSEPIELDNAVYLLLVEEKRPAHTRSLSEVRQQVEEILLQEERDRLEKQWIDRLRKKTFVRYF